MRKTNEELVVEFQQGKISFEEIFERCRNMIYKEAHRWTIRDMDFDDNVSVLMLALYEACERFDIEKGFKFSTYATSHLKGRIRDCWRKTTLKSHGGHCQYSSLEAGLERRQRAIFEAGLIKASKDPCQSAIDEELEIFIEKSLEEIPQPSQDYIRHFLFEGLTRGEISEMYDKSSSNINYHLKQGFKKIKNNLITIGYR